MTDETPPRPLGEDGRERRPPRPMDASGIIAVRTGFLRVSRRIRKAPKLPRPSWALSLGLLLTSALLSGMATLHRASIDRRFASTVRQNAAAPFEIKRIRRELADLDADEKTLSRDLDVHLKYLQSLKSEEFFIVLDSGNKRMQFHNGDRVVRDAPAEPGPARTIEWSDKRWTFPALSGAYSIREKLEDADWTPPPWVYALNGVKPPDAPPVVESGLGRYVIVLSDDAVIHSPPPEASPLKGAKPGSFEVPEADLAAIWKRVGPRTRVYAF